jgi:hypothetical protein
MTEQPQIESQPTVVIVDSKTNRSEGLVIPFAALGCKSVLVYKGGKGKILCSEGDTPPSQCLLLLRHLGDIAGEWPKIQADLTVYYSGSGGNDNRLQEFADLLTYPHDVIWKRVDSKEDALTKEEADQLVSYARDKAAGKDVSCLPFLQRPQLPIFEVLPALSILCQAYLAQLSTVHGQTEPQPPRTQECVDELIAWGDWPQSTIAGTDGVVNGQQTNSDVAHQAVEIQPYEPKWWQVFAGVSLQSEAKREWTSLEAQAKNGASFGWDKVETLLNAIQPQATESIKPISTKMVVEAYAAIVHRFG